MRTAILVGALLISDAIGGSDTFFVNFVFWLAWIGCIGLDLYEFSKEWK